jgi:predicted nucleotidyltransferase
MTPTQATLTAHGRPDGPQALRGIDHQLVEVLSQFPGLELAVLFGSVALGHQQLDSDLDIAVAARRALTVAEKMALIEALADRTGRPIDLVDLKVVAEPLLGQIVRHGRRLLGSDSAYGQLISRHLFEQADFMPYRSRVLAERRAAWTGK